MRKYILPLILILFLTFTLVGNCVTELDYMEYANNAAAQAAYVSNAAAVDQSSSGTGDSLPLGDAADLEARIAQSFILSGQLTVTAVTVRRDYNTVGTPAGNWTLRIETDASDLPSGTLADVNATVVVTPPAVDTDVKGTFATPFVLNAATLYHLVIECDDQNTNNYWRINYGGGNDYANGTQTKKQADTWSAGDEGYDLYFKVHAEALQVYSESSIKEQGSYSLKGVAIITTSLNKTLTRTTTIDLTDQTQIKYDIRGSRTGSQIKIGIHDSGGTTTEDTANISQANVNQAETWDISGVSNANKDDIDSIIITIVNADAANTFYIDNMYAEIPAVGITWNGITISKWNGITITTPLNTQ